MPKKQLIMVRTRKISPIESHSAPLTFTHPSLNIILYHNFKIILPTGGNRQVNHTKQGQIPRNGETPCPFPGGPGRKTDGRHAENEKVLAAEYLSTLRKVRCRMPHAAAGNSGPRLSAPPPPPAGSNLRRARPPHPSQHLPEAGKNVKHPKRQKQYSRYFLHTGFILNFAPN